MPKPARQKEETKTVVIYDPAAQNRLPYEVRQDGAKYSIAHVFGPLTDERYLQWMGDLKVRGTADQIEENSREASIALWNDLIVELDGAEYDPSSEWKQFIDSSEKAQAVNDLLAVAIVEEESSAGQKLQLGPAPTEQTLVTECFFNGGIVQQTHVLRMRTAEDENRFERIKRKETKQEQTRGLRRKANVEFVPQDEKLGELYDAMARSVTGFAGDLVPLRFKALIMNYVFAPKLDRELLGK